MPDGIQITPFQGLAGNATGSQGSASTQTAPTLFTAYGGYQLVDSTHNYRLRFEIPAQITLVRKVRLAFSLVAAVYVSQSTTAGSTTGAGTAHNHNITNSDGTTVVTSSGSSGVSATFNESGTAVTRGVLGPNGVNPPGQGAGVRWQTFSESAHTHSIPTLNLSAPSALGTGANATGATILLNGSAITPVSGNPQPPYTGPNDFDDLDITSTPAGVNRFQPPVSATGGGTIYEIQLTSTSIGGIIAGVQILGELTVS